MSEETHKKIHDEKHLDKLTIKELRDIAAEFPHERAIHDEVVEEPVVGRGPDPALRVREQLGHRRRQQVGGGVAVDLDRGVGGLRLAGRTCRVEGRGARRRHQDSISMSGPLLSSGRLAQPRGLVGADGIEPSTSSVSRKRSTTEPRA